MKRIFSMGAALVLMLSPCMTASAGHHAPCITRIIQSSGLCHYGDGHESGHHLLRHEGWTDCGLCGVDVDGLCERWRDCGNGYGAGAAYGSQDAGEAAQDLAADITVPESQVPGSQAAENQAEPQPEDAAPSAETYDGSAAVPYYGGNGNGGHHEERSCYPDNYNTGCHGSGHHGRGHH